MKGPPPLRPLQGRADQRAARDTIGCSDLKPLTVYVRQFSVAHSLLLSLVTAASLRASPPVLGAHDWSIFLYLIAGDEQQRVPGCFRWCVSEGRKMCGSAFTR